MKKRKKNIFLVTREVPSPFLVTHALITNCPSRPTGSSTNRSGGPGRQTNQTCCPSQGSCIRFNGFNERTNGYFHHNVKDFLVALGPKSM